MLCQNHKIKMPIQKILEKRAASFFVVLLGLSLFCFSGVSLADPTGDPLSGIMTSASSAFGTGSSFLRLLYGLEIIGSIYAYHKTKNVAMLAGVVVISIFANYALGHFVFTS